MKKYVLITLILALIGLSACETNHSEFTINESSVGKLSKTTKISELERIYANDSIVTNDSIGLKNGTLYSSLLIYDKAGTRLLRLQPKGDSTRTIGSIRVYDPRFKTDNNIRIGSNFKDLKSIGKIDKILPALNSVSITIKGSSIFYSIDRKELPDVLKYDRAAIIEALQIPDNATVSNIMIQW
jgi:hypothetical protein